jgi:hypothetical protein
MRQLFKVAYTIIGILLAIFIVVKVVNSLKSTKPPLLPKNLEWFIDNLKKIQKDMKSNRTPVCIIDKTKYTTDKIAVNAILSNPDLPSIIKYSNQPTVDIFNKLKESIKQSYTVYDKLFNEPDCQHRCYQGTYNPGTTSCACDGDYPYPIEVDGKIYCWNGDCSATENKIFTPGGIDPKTNNCECMPGYMRDPTNPQNCIKSTNPEIQKLIYLTEELKTLKEEYEKHQDPTQTNLFFFCKTDLASELIKNIQYNNQEVENIINMGFTNLPIPPQLKTNYQDIKKYTDVYITTYNNLLTCDKYCWQAKFNKDTNDCKCETGNPIKFNFNGRAQLYCDNCGAKDTNSHLEQPLVSNQNPDSHICVCNSGFNKCGSEKCEDCNGKLVKFIKGLTSDQNDIEQNFVDSETFKTTGQYTIGANQYIIFPNSSFNNPGTLLSSGKATSLIDCLNIFNNDNPGTISGPNCATYNNQTGVYNFYKTNDMSSTFTENNPLTCITWA